jgi:hypothetical protein
VITFCAGVRTYDHPTTSTVEVVDLMGPSAEDDKDLVSCLHHVSFMEASFLLLCYHSTSDSYCSIGTCLVRGFGRKKIGGGFTIKENC